MSNAPLPSIPPSCETELGREDRIELAYTAWIEAGGHGNRILLITKAAKQYGILKSTLADRIRGRKLISDTYEGQQRITPGEEVVLLA